MMDIFKEEDNIDKQIGIIDNDNDTVDLGSN